MTDNLSRFPTSKGWEDIATQTRGDRANGGAAGANHDNIKTGASGAAQSSSVSSSDSDSILGPLVRLWGIGRAELPQETATADELRPFLAAVLAEAAPFIDSATPQSSLSLPSTAWKQASGAKRSRESAAPVARSSRIVAGRVLDRLVGEKWKDVAVGGGAVRDWLGSPLAGEHGGGGDGDGDVSPGNVSVRETPQTAPSPRAVRARRERHRRGSSESWFCRRSVHEDAARRGTASWDEFDRYHRREHAQAEKELSPDVVAVHEAVRWAGCEGVEIHLPSSGDGGGDGEAWQDFSLSMQEMRHKVGRPVLRDRTFPVLQMTCRRVIASGTKDGPGTRDHDTTPAAAGPDGETPEPPADTEVAVESTGGDDISQAADDAAAAAAAADTKTPDVGNNTGQEFLVVSIPVPDFGEDKRSKLASEANAQVAVYVSVERVRKMASNGQIEWVMATASDAGGVLPMWVQTAAVPTKLWKDVPMLFSWLVKRRSEGA